MDHVRQLKFAYTWPYVLPIVRHARRVGISAGTLPHSMRWEEVHDEPCAVTSASAVVV